MQQSSPPPAPWTRSLVGVLSLCVSLAGIAWWIYVAESTVGGQAARVERFLGPFPGVLQDAKLVTWIQIVFSGLAFWMFFQTLGEKAVPGWLSKMMLCFAGLIGFWLLFSLM